MAQNPKSPDGTRTDQRWAIAWTAWIVYFAVAERAALKSGNRRAPLSYYLRQTVGVGRHPWHRRAGRIVAGGAFVWLIDHLSTQPPKD